MLIVKHPAGYMPERKYVLRVLLGDFLGLTWRHEASDVDSSICIQRDGQPGEIRLPDVFFRQPESQWLSEESLPSKSLAQWDTRELASDITLVAPQIPMIYGNAQTTALVSGQLIDLPIDIFGSAFFMLSRYEEAVRPDRDNHGRFPAEASLARRAGFLDRPLVDEYVEILWAAMQRLWPGLQRKPLSPRTLVSCDVDSPFLASDDWTRTLRRVGGDLLKRRSAGLAWQTITNHRRATRGDFSTDPHRRAIDWIMDVNERAGRPAAFYFIPENTDARLDNDFGLQSPRMRELLRHIHTRGHEIGVHPGYNTYRNPDAMGRTVDTMRRVLDEEGIRQPQLGGRQHFLRWETPTTARLWDDNGLDYDTTLSYADRPGFRCGTCREYPLYDVQQRRPLKLRERPLIVMECSVIAERYLGLGYSDEALNLMKKYRAICHHMHGDFTLLWHNSHLQNEADRRFYLELVG